jgi:hypothetical protein
MKPRPTYAEYRAEARLGNSANARRLRLEDAITRALVRHLAARGFAAVMVDDGGDRTLVGQSGTVGERAERVLALAGAVDEAWVYFRAKGKNAPNHPGGAVRGSHWVSGSHWVFLVYGNGEHLVSDWSYSEGDADGFRAAMDAFDADKVVAP